MKLFFRDKMILSRADVQGNKIVLMKELMYVFIKSQGSFLTGLFYENEESNFLNKWSRPRRVVFFSKKIYCTLWLRSRPVLRGKTASRIYQLRLRCPKIAYKKKQWNFVKKCFFTKAIKTTRTILENKLERPHLFVTWRYHTI